VNVLYVASSTACSQFDNEISCFFSRLARFIILCINLFPHIAMKALTLPLPLNLLSANIK